MRFNLKSQGGFTLVEMIVVMVIIGILGGMVAMFIRAPVQGYVDSARRAEMTDIADTALRRLARDIRTAVPNSIRVANCGGVSCVEFLPTWDGGRYRANATGGKLGCGGTLANALDELTFAAPDTCFEIVGAPITFLTGDQIVIGSTQAVGNNRPYQAPTSTVCSPVDTSTCIRRTATEGVLVSTVNMTPSVQFPAFAAVQGRRFNVVPDAQQAVTYACLNVGTTAGEGTGTLTRYWRYGFIGVQPAPPITLAGVQSAILADKVSACEIVYNIVVNNLSGLVAIRLGITHGGESISLYHQVHVNNVP